MQTCIQKLLEISGEPLCKDAVERPRWDRDASHVGELVQLAQRKNGFYAFESALHVLPLCRANEHMTLDRWNDSNSWRALYEDAVENLLFFAEDIFGEQFAIADGKIVSFNPESGTTDFVANTLEDWACRILTEYEGLTGYPFARDWQHQNGALTEGERLVPKTPFIFGGQYDVNNLYALDAVKGMRFRGDVFRQIRHLPDGAKVKITFEGS